MRPRLFQVPCVMLMVVLGTMILQGQLDPRLQASPTDFLDLYQSSASFRPKPEVLSILDTSRGMATLMPHPLYPNRDLGDREAYQSMTFSLEEGLPGSPFVDPSKAPARGRSSADSAGQPGPIMTLNPCVGRYQVPGIRYLTAPLVGQSLIKPNGAPVTLADAEAVDPSAPGAGRGSRSVYNWIRAASHVRMSAQVDGITRTIDIPIPWKLVEPTSNGNPLRSLLCLDRQVKREGAQTVAYGSDQQLEMDTCYDLADSISGKGQDDLAVAQISKWLLYPPAYVSWLFTATFQNGDPTQPNYTTEPALVGKFVVFDAVNPALAAGQRQVDWGRGFGPEGAWGPMTIPIYRADGSYAGTAQEEASRYRVPAMTRLQAMKAAAIRAWVGHQADVIWAYRCLDGVHEAAGGLATHFDNNSRTSIGTPDGGEPGVVGPDSAWWVMNNTLVQGPKATDGNSVNGMRRLAGLFPTGERPLTYAMARALAQYADPSHVFNGVGEASASACSNAFLILVTGGPDNNGIETGLNANLVTPYLSTLQGVESLAVLAGNRALIGEPNSLDRDGAWWSFVTFAAAAAHLADPTLGTAGLDYLPASTQARRIGTPSSFMPYAIQQRNGLRFARDHRITTMTVGVGVAGQVTDAFSPKRALFLAAALGDPGASSGTLASYHPFQGWEQPPGEAIDGANDWLPDPQDPAGYPRVGRRRTGAVYFFDGTDPTRLSLSLDFAFRMAVGTAGNPGTSNAGLATMGTSLGHEWYVGRFAPPAGGGVLWSGDVLAFATRQMNGQTEVLDRGGTPTGTFDATTALWSAADALCRGAVGTDRRLFTRIPGGNALQAFKEHGLPFTDAVTGLKNVVATSLTDLTEKQRILQHAAGADILRLNISGAPTVNRANLLGDIIHSSPAVVEYAWNRVSDQIAGFNDLASLGGNRFRLILVGTNQGWLHAFGEVARTDTQGVLRAVVQELWSFMPTDFLANLDYLRGDGNPHRFMVDGTPLIYHLDLPPGMGGAGNGLVDAGERVVGVFGLRRGGRSTYALDLSDPFNPTLRWSLVPDEGASFPAARNRVPGLPLEDLRGLIQSMGFSSSSLAVGRIQDANGGLRDALFLGGGDSVPEVEAQFGGQPLGRSVLALDVYTGEVLAAVDLTAELGTEANLGAISAGLVPFEFILNSGMAQRAYFMDTHGGLWAWGSKSVTSTPPYVNFRVDSAELSTWKIRKVYQDSEARGQGLLYTASPAPFRVGSFPGISKTSFVSPATVGIAMVSGDRNNPLDRAYDAVTHPAPLRHRLTVVFDRQDSRAWGLDTPTGPDVGITDMNLRDFTGNIAASATNDPCASSLFQKITPGCPDYYLAPFLSSASGTRTYLTPSFGYVVNFPVETRGYIPKGIQAPMVVNGALLYSIFTPTAGDPCSGGAGQTTSWIIADALNPLVSDARPGRATSSGWLFTWNGVASDFLNAGRGGILQGGMLRQPSVTGSDGVAWAITGFQGAFPRLFSKTKVWRTVH